MADYELSFAGIGFCIDTAKVFRINMQRTEDFQKTNSLLPVGKYQPEDMLVDELNRILPFDYMQDFSYDNVANPNINLVAQRRDFRKFPNPDIKIGHWYYPVCASRWSVFRGLATSSQVKQMLAATRGNVAGTFKIKQKPLGANKSTATYEISTDLFLLPPRCLGEVSKTYDGLYLVTLVDERFYWQNTGLSFDLNSSITWNSLITQVATTLGISISCSDISSAYTNPELNSQLWSNEENAGILFDALAYNIGRKVVRNYDGTYALLTPDESYALALANRGNPKGVLKTAGGDFFTSGLFPVGNLNNSRNTIVPASINVQFPYYIVGNNLSYDFLYTNPAYPYLDQNTKQIFHTENVPYTSGGINYSGFTGLSGAVYSCKDTAKALCATEQDLTLLNQSGVTALAVQIASDYYKEQVLIGLDESYPGIVELTPEGIHDAVFIYSAHSRMCTTRLLRTEWDGYIDQYQHSTPVSSGYTNLPNSRGLTVRDSFSGIISTVITNNITSVSTQVPFDDSSYFPTQNRWKGLIGSEKILFEGTSGLSTVDVVYRGIDGTIPVSHNFGDAVTQVTVDTSYKVNVLTFEKGQFTYPNILTSGGISEAKVVPQTQTIRVLSQSGTFLNGMFHYSGVLQIYNSTVSGSTYVNRENVWVTERNNLIPFSGNRYDGQFVGYNDSPIYSISNQGGTDLSGNANVNINNYTFSSGEVHTWNVNNQWLIQASGNVPNSSGYYGSIPNYVTYNAPIIICGFQFWCCFTVPDFQGIYQDPFYFTYPATVYRISSSISTIIYSIQRLVDALGRALPQLICFINVGTQDILLAGVDIFPAGSLNVDDGNKIILPNSEENDYLTLAPNDSAILWYDACQAAEEGVGHWRVLNTTANIYSSSAGGGGKDMYYWRHVNNGTYERWYYGGVLAAVVPGFTTAATFSAGTLIAMPFCAPRGGTLDRIGMRFGAGAVGALVRLGIYNVTSDTNLYPGTLLVDAGEVDVSSNGTKTLTINQTLVAGQLYWLVMNMNNGGLSPYTIAMDFCWPIMGSDASFIACDGLGFYLVTAYAALANPFPAGASVWAYAVGEPPAIGVRFSA